MATNQFENSRISEGTLQTSAQHSGNGEPVEPEISDMIAEGGPVTEPYKIRLSAASTLLGARVRNSAGEELGSIEEIMLDLESGRIAYVVLSLGGFLGIGQKRFPVPWTALQVDSGEHDLILDMDRRTLEEAPDFDKDNWPDMADPAFGQMIDRHYSRDSYAGHRH